MQSYSAPVHAHPNFPSLLCALGIPGALVNLKEGGIQKKARVLSKNPFNSLPTHGPEAAVLGQAHHRPLRSPGSLSLQQRCRGRKTWQWTLSKEGSALKKCVCLFLEVRARTRVAKARSSILVKSRALPQLHC